ADRDGRSHATPPLRLPFAVVVGRQVAANRWGERTGPPTLWYLGNVDGPQCHANQVVPATSLVDDAMTPARKKGIVDQAGKPDLLPCRDNGFPAIRRRLTHGRVRYSPFLTRRSHCIVERNSFRFLPPNSIARSNGKVQRNEFRSTWKNEASVAS